MDMKRIAKFIEKGKQNIKNVLRKEHMDKDERIREEDRRK